MSDSNVDLSALCFFPQRTRTPPCWNGKVRLMSDVSGHSTIQSLACFRRNQCFFAVGMISYSWVTSGVMRERDKAKKGKTNRSIRKHDYVESWAGFIVIFFSQCTAIAMYFNFSEKLKFTKIYVLFHKCFFWHESQPAGPVTKTKKGQYRVKKSKTTLVPEIWSP